VTQIHEVHKAWEDILKQKKLYV